MNMFLTRLKHKEKAVNKKNLNSSIFMMKPIYWHF